MKNDTVSINSKIFFLAIVSGFCGGFLASIFVFGLNKFPSSILEQGHPLISTPFLAFVGAIIVIGIFYKPIQSLLSRGQVKIKWGDKEISLSEIENKVEAEFHEYDSKLTDLDVEIKELKKMLDVIGKEKPSENEEDGLSADVNDKFEKTISTSITQKIKDNFDWVNSDKLATLVYHLATSRYRWRSQQTLVKKTGVTASEIDEFVYAFPEHIIRSQGKSGNTIYRLSNKMKAQYTDVIEFG